MNSISGLIFTRTGQVSCGLCAESGCTWRGGKRLLPWVWGHQKLFPLNFWRNLTSEGKSEKNKITQAKSKEKLCVHWGDRKLEKWMLLKGNGAGCVVGLVPALGLQKQMDLRVWDQPGLESEFQARQGYRDTLSLKVKELKSQLDGVAERGPSLMIILS